MEKNYYTILGIERNASGEDIKKAFHRLARKYHPDNKTTGDEQKFKEINEAYQTLSDDRKRSEYDTYGRVFSGAYGGRSPFGDSSFEDFSDFGTANNFEFDFGDIFNEFFGGGRAPQKRRGRDISIDMEISFAEAVYGTRRSVLIGKTSLCGECKGSGAKKEAGFDICKTCNGQGRVRESRNSFIGTFTNIRECSACKGIGKIPKEKCSTCSGAGVIRGQEEITIQVPAGIQNGEVIRLSGAGEAVSNGASGDLYIKIHIGAHPIFKRDGHNLIMSLDIKLSDAILGTEYPIQILDGGTLKLKIPQGTSLGETLRIRGKVIPIDRGRNGDLLIKLNVKLPKNLSSKAKKLFEDLKGEGI